MAIIQGYQSQSYIGWEPTSANDTFEASLATATTYQVPFTNNALVSNQSKNESAVLTGRRAMSRPFFGNTDVSGSIEMPFDADLAGVLFKAACGNVTSVALDAGLAAAETFYHVGTVKEDAEGNVAVCTNAGVTGLVAPDFSAVVGTALTSGTSRWVTIAVADTGLFSHTFTISSAALPYLFVEKAVKVGSGTGIYETYRGCKLNSLNISVGGDGEMLVGTDIMGVKAGDPTATRASKATVDANFTTSRVQFQNFLGSVSARHTSDAGDNDALTADSIKDFSLTINNNLAGDEYTINSRGFRREIPEGMSSISGSINALFEDTKALNLARAGTKFEMCVGLFSIQNPAKPAAIQLLMNETEITPFDVEISGPEGINVSYDYMSYQDTGSSVIQVTLVNTVAGTVYTPA